MKPNPGPLPVRVTALSAAEVAEPAPRVPPPQSRTARRPPAATSEEDEGGNPLSSTSGTLPSLSPSRSQQEASHTPLYPYKVRAMQHDRHSGGCGAPLSPDSTSSPRSALGSPQLHVVTTSPLLASRASGDASRPSLAATGGCNGPCLPDAATTPTSRRGSVAAGHSSDSLAALRRARNDAQPMTLGNPSMLRHLNMRKERRLSEAAKKSLHSFGAATHAGNSSSGVLLHTTSSSQKFDAPGRGPLHSPTVHTSSTQTLGVFSSSGSAVYQSGSTRPRDASAAVRTHVNEAITSAVRGPCTSAPFVLHSEEREELVHTKHGVEKRRHTVHEVRLPPSLASSLYPREGRAGESGEGSKDRGSSTPSRSKSNGSRSRDSPATVEVPQTDVLVKHTPPADASHGTGRPRVSTSAGRHYPQCADTTACGKSDSGAATQPRSPCVALSPPAKTKVGIPFRNQTIAERLTPSPASAEVSGTSSPISAAGAAALAPVLPTTPHHTAATTNALSSDEQPRDTSVVRCASADDFSIQAKVTSAGGLSASLQSPPPSAELLSRAAASPAVQTPVSTPTIAAADLVGDPHALTSPTHDALMMSHMPRPSLRPTAATPSLLSRARGAVRSASVASSTPPHSALYSYGASPVASVLTTQLSTVSPGGGRIGWETASAAPSPHEHVASFTHTARCSPQPLHRVQPAAKQLAVTSLSPEEEAFLSRVLGDASSAGVDSALRMH